MARTFLRRKHFTSETRPLYLLVMASFNEKTKSTCFCKCFFWLVAPKKISPDYLKKPLVVRLFRPFFNPYCLTCSGCDTFSFFVRTEKDILIHLKSNFIPYLLSLRISQNGIFNISIVVMQKIDRFFAEEVCGINNPCSCKIKFSVRKITT